MRVYRDGTRSSPMHPRVLGGLRRRGGRGMAWRGVVSKHHAAAAVLLTPTFLHCTFFFSILYHGSNRCSMD